MVEFLHAFLDKIGVASQNDVDGLLKKADHMIQEAESLLKKVTEKESASNKQG